jgi:hypothetical protein
MKMWNILAAVVFAVFVVAGTEKEGNDQAENNNVCISEDFFLDLNIS